MADRTVAEWNKVLATTGSGSGPNLVEAVAGNWMFTDESGVIPSGTTVKIQDAVDATFLPH